MEAVDGQARGDPKQRGFHYLPEYFETLRCPVMRKDFPRCVVIPEHHVRYVFATHLFWTAIPRFFLNNEMAAKAVFVHAVMGFYAGKLWDGEHGVGHG